MWADLLPGGSFLFCISLPQRPCQRVGGGGVPPWGPSIRRPPKVCEACWTIITSPFRYVQIKSQRANLKGQAHYARPGSCSPLFFSPQEAGDHRSPPLNLRVLRLVGPLGSIFCSSDTLFKNDIEKTSKKMRKSRILASQNPPKTHPKCLQNRGPKNHAIFHRFLLEF